MSNKIAINIYLSKVESKKQNKQQAQQKQAHRYREHFNGCQVEGWLGMGEKGEGVRGYKLVVTELSQECKVQHREYSQYYSNNDVWCQIATTFIRMIT